MQITPSKTERFEQDVQHFNLTLRKRIESRVNEIGLASAHRVPGTLSFARLVAEHNTDLHRVPMELGEGYEASLYTVEASSDIYFILSVDDDPLFDQVIVTFYRAVRKSLLERACQDVVQSLYKSLPNFVVPQEVAIG